jgi:hypothetical protein
MRYIKKYKLFESTTSNYDSIIQDLYDILVDLVDDGHKVEINKDLDQQSIIIRFILNKDKLQYVFNSNGLFSTDEFKRAYHYLQNNEFDTYYLEMNNGEFSEPSSSFEHKTPWLIDFHDERTDYEASLVEIEFHQPMPGKFFVIGWNEDDGSDWEPCNFKPVSREEANELLDERRRKGQTEEMKRLYKVHNVNPKYSIISDREFWDKKR